jgi:hypothetical protein
VGRRIQQEKGIGGKEVFVINSQQWGSSTLFFGNMGNLAQSGDCSSDSCSSRGTKRALDADDKEKEIKIIDLST